VEGELQPMKPNYVEIGKSLIKNRHLNLMKKLGLFKNVVMV
jgi:hypothetical protein